MLFKHAPGSGTARANGHAYMPDKSGRIDSVSIVGPLPVAERDIELELECLNIAGRGSAPVGEISITP